MVITQIQKTKQGRYALFVDGTFLFSVHADTYTLSDLAVGWETDVRRLEELRQADALYSCKDKALSLLGYASHSRGMLVEKLCRIYEPDVVQATADRMEELGLLDDLDYGTRLASDLIHLRGWSLRRVEQELYRKKLDPQTVAQVMEALRERDRDGDLPRVMKLLRGRYRGKLQDTKGVNNTIAALLRQGFLLSDVKAALGILLEEEDGAGSFDDGEEEP